MCECVCQIVRISIIGRLSSENLNQQSHSEGFLVIYNVIVLQILKANISVYFLVSVVSYENQTQTYDDNHMFYYSPLLCLQ